MTRLIPVSKNLLIQDASAEYRQISNFGNRTGYRLLQRAYNGRYRAETYKGDGGYWIVFIDKKDEQNPIPWLGNTFADRWDKLFSVSDSFRRLCRKYGLTNRETTKWYHIITKE